MLRTLAARALGGASATTSGSSLSSCLFSLSSSSLSSTAAASTTTTAAPFFSSVLFSSRSYASSVSGSSEAEFGLASGVPEHLLKREVVIYAPSRTPSQQGMSQTDTPGGLGKGACWRIEFETKQKWINPLMGWTSTADPYENVGRAGMSFDSREAAAAFCDKHGWTYVVKEGFPSARLRPARFNQYGDNFSVKRKGIPDGGLVSENGGKVEVSRKSSSSARASSTATGVTEGKSSKAKAKK